MAIKKKNSQILLYVVQLLLIFQFMVPLQINNFILHSAEHFETEQMREVHIVRDSQIEICSSKEKKNKKNSKVKIYLLRKVNLSNKSY